MCVCVWWKEKEKERINIDDFVQFVGFSRLLTHVRKDDVIGDFGDVLWTFASTAFHTYNACLCGM